MSEAPEAPSTPRASPRIRSPGTPHVPIVPHLSFENINPNPITPRTPTERTIPSTPRVSEEVQQLRLQLHDKEGVIEGLHLQLTKALEDTKNCQDTLVSITREEEKNAELKATITDLDSRLQVCVEKAQNVIEVHEEEFKRLGDEAAKDNVEFKRLDEVIDKLVEELKQCKGTQTEQKKKIDAMVNRNDKIEKQSQLIKSAEHNHIQRNISLRKTNKNLELDLKRQNESIESQRDKIQNLQDELQLLQKQNATCKEELSNLKSIHSQKQHEVTETINQGCNELRNQLKDLRSQLKTTQDEKSLLDLRSSECQTRLSLADRNYNECTRNLSLQGNKLKEVKQLQELISSLRQEHEHHKEQLQSMVQEKEQGTESLIQCNEFWESCKTEVTDLQSKQQISKQDVTQTYDEFIRALQRA